MVVSLDQGLGPKLHQPEPQPQPHEVMKRCQQVSECNCFGASFDKTNKILYTLGRNGLEWYGKVATTNKQNRPNEHVLLFRKQSFTELQAMPRHCQPKPMYWNILRWGLKGSLK